MQSIHLHLLFGASVVLASVLTFSVAEGEKSNNCTESDKKLNFAREIYCCSQMGPGQSWCNYPPPMHRYCKKDWPSQAAYFINILALLDNVSSSPSSSCLNTTIAQGVINWIEKYQSNISLGGSLIETWAAPQGQPNYFEQPRKPGARIESPSTLGFKCFPPALFKKNLLLLKRVSERVGVSRLEQFTSAYKRAIPVTMMMCNKVVANCFQNTSYQPKKYNGTCGFQVDEFKFGYKWKTFENCELEHPHDKNLWCPVEYPYWS